MWGHAEGKGGDGEGGRGVWVKGQWDGGEGVMEWDEVG